MEIRHILYYSELLNMFYLQFEIISKKKKKSVLNIFHFGNSVIILKRMILRCIKFDRL